MNVTVMSEVMETFQATHLDSVAVQAVTVSIAILVVTLGNALLASIYLYEKFGQDPQKRTLANILISDLTVFLIAYVTITLPLMTARLAFGPLGKLILR